MTWGQLLRIGAELAIDLVRDAIKERQAPAPAQGLPWKDVERQRAQAAAAVAHKVPK